MTFFFDKLFQIFEDEGEQLFVVGGFCRDLMKARMEDDLWELAQKHIAEFGNPDKEHIGEHPKTEKKFWLSVMEGKKDIDFATSALPEDTMLILQKHRFPVWPIGLEYGTIQTEAWGLKFEITTFRCEESYKKGSRKPSVKFGKTIEEDLARRDLTINSIAMDRNENLIDPFGGFNDIIEGGLWTPLDAKISFGDDPLRMLRVCRFMARWWWPSWQVGEAMKELKKEIHNISNERIFEEVTKILLSSSPSRGFKLMKDTGILKEIFPELQEVADFETERQSKDLWKHVMEVVDQSPQDSVIRWAALFHDVGKPETVDEGEEQVTFHNHEEVGFKIWEKVAERLKTGNDFKEKVAAIIRESGNFVELKNKDVTDKALRRFVRKVGPHLDNIFQFAMVDMTSKHPEKIERMKKETQDLKNRIDNIIECDNIVELKLPSGTGDLLMKELNLKPSPELGNLMKILTQKLVDGDINLKSDFVKEAKDVINESEDY